MNDLKTFFVVSRMRIRNELKPVIYQCQAVDSYEARDKVLAHNEEALIYLVVESNDVITIKDKS